MGKDIEKYFGKDKGALIYLKPNGVWYAQGLYEWLTKEKKKDIIISTMEDDGTGLEAAKLRGRKVLIVDADVVTGKAYKRSMELYPKRFNGLLGAARAAGALGEPSLARTFYQELLDVADGGMRQPAIKEAQNYVAQPR